MIKRTNIGVWTSEDNKWHYGISPEVGLYFLLEWIVNLTLALDIIMLSKRKTQRIIPGLV